MQGMYLLVYLCGSYVVCIWCGNVCCVVVCGLYFNPQWECVERVIESVLFICLLRQDLEDG